MQSLYVHEIVDTASFHNIDIHMYAGITKTCRSTRVTRTISGAIELLLKAAGAQGSLRLLLYITKSCRNTRIASGAIGNARSALGFVSMRVRFG